MSKACLAVVLSAALSAPACTLLAPITLAADAAGYNQRAKQTAARTGKPTHRRSVPARLVGGLIGGLYFDVFLLVGVVIAVDGVSHGPFVH